MPVKNLNRAAPSGLGRVASRCLQEDRNLRCQRVSEIRADLERLKRRQELLGRLRRARPLLGVAAVLAWGCHCWVSGDGPLPPPLVSAYVQLTNDGQRKGLFEGDIVTEGSHLYFGEGSGMAAVIAKVSTSGGETYPVPEAPVGEPEAQDISPSRSELLTSNYMGFGRKFGWAFLGFANTVGHAPPCRKYFDDLRRLTGERSSTSPGRTYTGPTATEPTYEKSRFLLARHYASGGRPTDAGSGSP